MSRHPDPTDPLEAADLDALDAALAGDGADPEWAALVAAIRSDAPAPRPRFQDDLDARVSAGFPRTRPRWLRPPALPARRVLPALAVASALLVGGVVVERGVLDGGDQALSGRLGGDDEATSAMSSGSQASVESAPVPAPAQEDSAASSGAASSSAQPPSSVATSPALPLPSGRTDRRVERSTSLALRTSADRLQEAAGGIVRATQDLGGVVASSQVDSSPSGGQATFVLSVPADRLDDALKRYGELADVRRLTQGAEDVTGAFVSAQDRLSDARAERRALLAALGSATTPGRIASLRARIAGNRREIARLEADLRGLRRRTENARVDVTLRASGSATAPDAGSAWGPGDAARDALRVLEVVAGVALVAAAVVLPLALLGGGAALAGRGLRRRRREAALGAG